MCLRAIRVTDDGTVHVDVLHGCSKLGMMMIMMMTTKHKLRQQSWEIAATREKKQKKTERNCKSDQLAVLAMALLVLEEG